MPSPKTEEPTPHPDQLHDVEARVRRPMRGRPRKLVRMVGGVAVGEYWLGEDAVALGREEADGVPLESAAASRRHAIILWRRGSHQIVDAESRHGVLLNGIRVHAAVLHDGDWVRLGDDLFLYAEG